MISKNAAIKFVVLLGIISLFADMTYEGARSIAGPYLAILGAKATVVGFVAGLGELIGYSLRLVSGYWAERTQRYWLITIIGYCLNLLAVPLLALAGYWWLAAGLLIIERLGKAIRTPARDAMLAQAAQGMGIGWGFGLHEALDQTGAMLGPLLIAFILYRHGSYQHGFALLAIPTLLALALLLRARWLYPQPTALATAPAHWTTAQLDKAFWLYLMGSALIGAGYADFSLMAYHFEKQHIMSSVWVPVIYAITMGISAITAPLLGYWYDKKGFVVVILVTIAACWFAPLVFFGNFSWAFVGVALWSIGMGAQDSLMQAHVARIVPCLKRASAYGIFSMGYGVFWFLGSVLMGFLYDTSILSLVSFVIVVQLLAIPFFWRVKSFLLSEKSGLVL